MFEFALPDLGEGVAEGEILEWHVAPGDAVSEDDVLLEVETDKAAVDVPSPVDGTIAERHGEPGDVVETGTVIVTIDTDGEGDATADDGETATGATKTEPPAHDDGKDDSEDGTATTVDSAGSDQRVFAPPSVRRLARELGVDVAQVSGSGPSGRVTEEDVRAAAEGKSEEPEPAREASDVKSAVRRVSASDEEAADATGADDDGPTSAVQAVGESGTGNGDAETDDELDDEDEPTVKSAVSSVDSTASRDRTLATPATRRLARELGVDVDAVPTDVTRDGEPFVDEAAVRAYAERQEADVLAAATAETTTDADTEADDEASAVTTGRNAADGEAGETAAGASEAAVETTAERTERGPADRDVGVARTEPYRGIRRRIGERMAKSRREVPHATHHDRVEVSELVAARERLEPLAEDRGVRLTYTPFVLKCVGAALQEHPVLNTRLDTDAEEIHYLDEYNVGVATDTERGLLVPVVEDVDDRGIVELAAATNDLVERARDGSIDASEMQGGTFTVTNVGAIGGEYADPVINVPQTAVLAVGSLRERPVAVDGSVEAKPTLPLSLAIDHRVIDGADAARFTNTLKTYLADPTRLLLE